LEVFTTSDVVETSPYVAVD